MYPLSPSFIMLVLVLKKHRNNTVKSLTTISTLPPLTLHINFSNNPRHKACFACYAFVLPIKVQLEMLCKSERFLLAISMPAVCSMYLCIDVSLYYMHTYVCMLCVCVCALGLAA